MKRRNRYDWWFGVVILMIMAMGVLEVYFLAAGYMNRMFFKSVAVGLGKMPLQVPRATPTLTLVPSPTLSPTPTNTPRPTPTPTPAIEYVSVFVTYYGFPDNDPAGRAIAYPASRHKQTLHNEAGGVGTFADPITMAASEGYLGVGTRVYLPYIQKYAIKEDWCANCGWGHVDLWMESEASHEAELYECMGRFTKRGIAMEIDPPPGRPVNTSVLFDSTTGACRATD